MRWDNLRSPSGSPSVLTLRRSRFQRVIEGYIQERYTASGCRQEMVAQPQAYRKKMYVVTRLPLSICSPRRCISGTCGSTVAQTRWLSSPHSRRR